MADAKPQHADLVLEALKAARGPMTTAEVAGATGSTTASAHLTLMRLVERRLVQRSKSGGAKAKIGQKMRSWRLHPSAAVVTQAPTVEALGEVVGE